METLVASAQSASTSSNLQVLGVVGCSGWRAQESVIGPCR
ncbi:hypothetical protein [Pseudomonas sp. P108]|nr:MULTISPECIES: hypothetical protein [unclassified Pseudomonas]WNZ87194.1 hypothetical protein QOM10_15065 [Pseudomonas sp. P108]